MEIREIKKEDIKDFTQDWSESSEQKKTTRETKYYVFAAYKDNNMAAYSKFNMRGGVANMTEIIVKKEYRRNGIAGALLDNFEKIAKTEKCHKLTLRTAETNIEALELYRKKGFIIEAELKNDKNHLTWYLLAKYINAEKKQRQ